MQGIVQMSPSAPLVIPTAMTFSSIRATSVNIGITSSNTTDYKLVIMCKQVGTNGGLSDPQDNVVYSAGNANYLVAALMNGGATTNLEPKIIARDTTTPPTAISGLTRSTNYWVACFQYSGSIALGTAKFNNRAFIGKFRTSSA